MKIIIKATNIKSTPVIEDYVFKKINSLERFTDGLSEKGVLEARIEIGKTTEHHQKGNFFRAEANLRLPGQILRSESEMADLYQAIDEMKDELQRQLKKYKERQIDIKKKEGRRVKEAI